MIITIPAHGPDTEPSTINIDDNHHWAPFIQNLYGDPTLNWEEFAQKLSAGDKLISTAQKAFNEVLLEMPVLAAVILPLALGMTHNDRDYRTISAGHFQIIAEDETEKAEITIDQIAQKFQNLGELESKSLKIRPLWPFNTQ